MSFTKNAPDEEAVRLLRYYEGLALHYDVRGYSIKIVNFIDIRQNLRITATRISSGCQN